MMKVVFFILGITFFVVGFLFKVTHWPFSTFLLAFAAISFLMSFVFHYWKKEDHSTTNILDLENLDDV